MQPSMSEASSSSFLLLIFFYALKFSVAVDFISSTQYLHDPESITSNGSIFRMGFFTLDGSNNRYVGIWYNGYSVFEPVWIANRERPLKDSSGTVMIAEDGNLVVKDGRQVTLWTSNETSSGKGNITAQLLDSGNLVLMKTLNKEVIWHSFEHPTDSYLPKMKISSNVRTHQTTVLTSWKSPSDPSRGNFSVGLDPLNIPEAFIWNGSRPIWRSGPWNGQFFIGIPRMESIYLNGFSLLDDKEGGFSLTYWISNAFINYLKLEPNGTFLLVYWVRELNDSRVYWSSYETECDVYGKCGPFGICDPLRSPICSCPRGFKPRNREEWSRGNWTDGCDRKKPLNCDEDSIINGTRTSQKDGFLRLETMKVPDFAVWSSSPDESSPEDECASRCLSNCSCVGYAYDAGVGCMSWTGDLIDMQQLPVRGATVHIRVPAEELRKFRDSKIVMALALSFGAIFVVLSAIIFLRWSRKRRARKIQGGFFSDREISPKISSRTGIQENFNLQELRLLTFGELSTATESFNIANKLGQGGFGPVYKGRLLDGLEIAVKRLSRASGQGLEEFMNEMVVISKVQHRNLVRLLGCCVEEDEKILVYEFMPNKSLDAFIFDPEKRYQLDWRTRFSIIDGICRGLLYLHRDSRLRIIHRDLKANNILLDEKMNPKISDFGTARIFGGQEDQANTRTIVGTYGYMAPEYATRGLFSEKSDVFSFGVLLLEIVSGKRNTGFNQDDECSSLIRFAWKLWNEDNIMTLVDPVISDESHQIEVLRCIHVGLLCLQELAKDRPATSTVISMLNSEIVDLPSPQKLAFTERLINQDTDSSGQRIPSFNKVTVTTTVGR